MSEPVARRHEDNIIEAFVKYLAAKLYPGLQIVEWPDKTNTRTPDIDAIAEGNGRRVAIEHTSADSFPNQRKHDERFTKAIGSLEQELKGRIDFRLRVITPFGSVSTGVRWMRFGIDCENGFSTTLLNCPQASLSTTLALREFRSL